LRQRTKTKTDEHQTSESTLKVSCPVDTDSLLGEGFVEEMSVKAAGVKNEGVTDAIGRNKHDE